MNPHRIECIERLGTTTNGNPRYRLALTPLPDAPVILATVQSDAAVSYDIGNPGYKVGDAVSVEFTKAGRVSRMTAI